MQPSDFTVGAPGRVVRTQQDYWAFVPAPLPPPLSISWDLAAQISAADRALSELAGAAGSLPNPHLLIGPFIRREAVLSSRIEGTQASLSDLFFFEAAGLTPASVPDVLEVANYVRALEHGLARLETLPVSLRLIREIHARLMQGVRGEYSTPGEFRRSQNWIGPPGCTLMDAMFVPPPVSEMQHALGEFENYLHSASVLPPLVRLALIHYQFEAIHPFLDGNGRVGRLLITLLLCAERLLAQPLLYLSAYFEQRCAEYYRNLLAVSQAGDWLQWIEFFLAGVAEQSRDALKRARLLLNLREEYRRRLQAVRRSGLLLRLADILFANPALTIPQTAALLDTTQRTASLHIARLVEAGILHEATGRRRARVFVAAEIVQAAERQRLD